jgi:hypothetical protein
MRTMVEAISLAEKHASRSEPLAALLAEATAALEQARSKVAREEEAAVLTRRMQSDALRL